MLLNLIDAIETYLGVIQKVSYLTRKTAFFDPSSPHVTRGHVFLKPPHLLCHSIKSDKLCYETEKFSLNFRLLKHSGYTRR